MAIFRNELQGNLKGFAMNKNLRSRINDRLNESVVIINKVEIVYDKENKCYQPIFKLGMMGMSPVAEEFGLNRDYRATGVSVEVDLDDDLTTSRKVDIDGKRYIYCDTLMTIECTHKAMIDKLDEEGFEFNGVTYKVLGASPSQEKHGVKVYYKVSNEVPDEITAFNKMDLVSGMVFSQGLFAKPVDGKDVLKGNTRWGNYLTTMQSLAQIDLEKDYIAVVKGSINGACDFTQETNEEMLAAGLEIDCNINDGGMYFNPAVIVEMAKGLGLTITEEDALKVALQVRVTYLTAKCMSRTMRKEQLEKLAAFGKADFYGNKNGRLMLVIDTDGAKLLNTTALKANKGILDIYVMAMAKASEPSTSGQHLIKYLYVNPDETLRLVNKMTKENLESYIMQQVEEGKGFTYASNLTKQLGEEAFSNKLRVEGMIEDSFKYIQSAIAKCKLSFNALYSHMMFDASFALTCGMINGVLRVTESGFVEAYSVDVLRKFRKEIDAIENNDELTEDEKDAKLFELLSGIVIKYPSAGPREFEIIVYLTERQIERSIKEQVAALGLDNNDAEEMVAMLLDYFNNTPFGTTVYAPLNSMKNKLAGADCDFDATMCDMSELKWILINERIEQRKAMPGFMGYCTYISYKDIDRSNLNTVVEDVAGNTDDIEF